VGAPARRSHEGEGLLQVLSGFIITPRSSIILLKIVVEGKSEMRENVPLEVLSSREGTLTLRCQTSDAAPCLMGETEDLNDKSGHDVAAQLGTLGRAARGPSFVLWGRAACRGSSVG